MDAQELDNFLRANIKVQVATAGKNGRPHLTTLFYIVLDDGRIAFWTYGRSQKIVNLERDPRITCLVEDGVDYFELRGASITGSAEIVREHDRILEIGGAVAARMVGVDSVEDLGEIGLDEIRRQAGKRVAVIVTPERVGTWDHRKMKG
ncbi:PPOX class probable F420-dependent enzyme [Nocardioides daedukensis]|uniref:PPOX class probable F420-dependent enzyme n=1 Tax=Nocardioides daedukensis TaxID=634462 RepID=A0A7Y9RZE3_9ACTN|nr:pyridoxamine 5'-phosphate oxidase family protein [Nocardioides daedukensis]NYG57587.1 PPOX class probable F420-dependent enzyme [Nocardioides daedukensis]